MGGVRLPIRVVWVAPPGAALRHAFMTGPAEREGWCLCSRYRGRRKLRGTWRQGLATTLPECPSCMQAVKLVAVGLPRADMLVTRALTEGAEALKRWALSRIPFLENPRVMPHGRRR